MIVSHYELEKEMHRRQCDIEQTAREELKFQEENRKTSITNKDLRSKLTRSFQLVGFFLVTLIKPRKYR
jgi:hypothetical protein